MRGTVLVVWGWIPRNGDRIVLLLVEHLRLALIPVLAGLLLAVPFGWLANRYRPARAVLIPTAGVRNADPAVVDAARGMGMREREVLLKVELPIALPLVIGGLRTATLQVVATAAIGAYISLGGLGRYLIDGLALNDYPRMVAGAVLIAALALVVEGLLAGLQRFIVSPGLRTAPTRTGSRRPTPVVAGGTV